MDADAHRVGRMELGRGAARLMGDLEEKFPGAEIESYVVLVNFREDGQDYVRWHTWPADAVGTERMQRALEIVVEEWTGEQR